MSEGRTPIPDFSGYWATKDGRIWSEPKNNGPNRLGQFLTPCFNHNGYLQVSLIRNGKAYSRKVHYLILKTFVGPRPRGMECCHNNGDKANNHLSNLRWDTKSSNIKDAFRHGAVSHKGEKNPPAKLNELQVRIIKYLVCFPEEFTQKEIGRLFEVSQTTVCEIKKGRKWKHLTKK